MASKTEKRKTSEIWNFFKIENEKAVCNICKQLLSYKSSVTNLKTHLKRKHPLINLQNLGTKRSTILNEAELQASTSARTTINRPEALVENQQSKYQENITDYLLPRKMNIRAKKKIDDQLLELFTLDLQPFSIVEDKGFKKLINLLNPSYTLPTRKAISTTFLPALYEETYHQIQNMVNNVKALTITTDCWTSINNDNYLAVTAHFISENFEMKSVLLDCRVSNTSHTSQNLATQIRSILLEWGINRKIILSVSDNAANIKKALSEELQLKHFGCFAHTLNLIVTKSLTLVNELVEKVKTIVGHFKRSPQSNAKLLDIQKQANKEPKKLRQDVPTRWNSTYYMLERFIELEEVVRTTVALIDKDLPILTSTDWELIKEIVQILEPMEDATKIVSGEEYLTGSLVIVIANGLKTVYNELKQKQFSQIGYSLLQEIGSGIDIRFATLEQSSTLITSTFLDPRFKNFAFSDESTFEKVKKIVINLVAAKIKNKVTEASEKSQNAKDASEEKCLLFKHLDQNIKSKVFQSVISVESKAIVEVQRYLEEPLLPRTENPLVWWQQQYSFPFVSEVAKEKLSVVGTSVPCERVFSKAGTILVARRNRLKAKTVQQILFLNANTKHVKPLQC